MRTCVLDCRKVKVARVVLDYYSWDRYDEADDGKSEVRRKVRCDAFVVHASGPRKNRPLRAARHSFSFSLLFYRLSSLSFCAEASRDSRTVSNDAPGLLRRFGAPYEFKNKS